MASTNFINECKNPAYENRLGKIIIDGVEYNQGNYLTELEVDDNIYNNGTIIGGTYTKGLKFSLINVDKDTEFVGKKATPSIGVKYNDNSTEYIEFDDYILEALNDEQTKNFTNITGYDSLNNLDSKYEYGLGEGDHTIGEYWEDLLANLGLETETETFTNDDIIVSDNPFVSNESNRVLLSEIEKVSCTYSKLEKRTRTVEGVTETYYVLNLYWLDLAGNPVYEFETSDYSTLEGSLTKYGPVNCVILGDPDIGGENVYLQDDTSITQNGETKVVINAEYFLYTQALRQQAIQGIYDKLLGLQYYDLSLTTLYGKPFLKVGDKIRVNTNEENVYDTYILSHTFAYNGTFKSVIKSPALTKQEEIVKSTESISDKVNRTEIMVDKANGEITSITSRTKYLEDNTYTIEQTNQLVQDAEHGLINTFSEAGGNNIFRNTGLWFGATTSEATVFPSNDLFPSDDLFMGNKVVYEFWEGDVTKSQNDKAVNMTSMLLLNGYLSQEQKVPNGYYVVSFKYKKLIALSTPKVKINDVEYPLNNIEDTEFIQIIEVNSQHINVQFYTNIDKSCEIYDLMVNVGQTKLAYSQNQNETTTDTVKIGQGITITSSNTDTIFKANADGIRTLDRGGNELTKFTDTGMTTKKMIVQDTSQIVGTLWQEVGGQTWITRL